MWYVCSFYTTRPPSLFFRGKFVTQRALYMHLYLYFCESYNGVCIDMFVYVVQPNFWLYLILGILTYISPMYGLFFHCIVVTFTPVLICLWMVYICLLIYVGVIHTIWYLVILHISNIIMHIYCIWFVIPLSPSSLTCINKSGLTPLCLN